MGILVVALAECLVVGWAWKGKLLVKMREHANERSDWRLYRWWDLVVRYVAPSFLCLLIIWSVADFVYEKRFLELAGSGVFIMIPVVFFLTVSRRETRSKTSTSDDEGLALRLLLWVPLGSVLLGITAGALRILFQKRVESAPAAETGPGVFAAGTLGPVAYAILAVTLVVISSGLVWCFWKAMQAASSEDPQMKGEGETYAT